MAGECLILMMEQSSKEVMGTTCILICDSVVCVLVLEVVLINFIHVVHVYLEAVICFSFGPPPSKAAFSLTLDQTSN